MSECVAPGGGGEFFHEQDGGVRAAGDAGDVEVGGEAEGADRARREPVWWIGEAQRARERVEAGGRGGGGEQRVGGARGEHGATVASSG